ncbi:unnamed protein product [Prunus armeniaca]
MNESSKRRLMLGMQGKKKGRQASTAPAPSGGVDPDDLTLNERRRQMQAESARAEANEAVPSPSRAPPSEGTSSRAAGKRPFTVDLDADPAPKRGRQTEPARAVFSAEDDEAPSEAVTLACPSKTRAFEESERARASEVEAAVQEAIQGYRRSTKFSTLLDKEVGSEMADLLYRFKRYNPGKKLNLNFIADPPPLPEGITEEMVEEYEGEDVTEEVPADPEGIAAEADGAAPDADEAAA